MKKIINYAGHEYGLLKELLQNYPKYMYICERKDLSSKIFNFYGESYITQETWDEIEKLIDLNENYYTSFKAINYFHKDNLARGKMISKILEANIPYIEYNANKYYRKTDIEKYKTLGALISGVSGQTVITAIELVAYHNKYQLNHAYRSSISEYHIKFLYERERWINLYGLLCIKIKQRNPYDELKTKVLQCNEMDFFNNYFGKQQRFPNTFKCISEFYRKKINDSSSSDRNSYAWQLTTVFYDFYSSLNKEIYQYSQHEVLSLLNENRYIVSYKEIIQFLEMIRMQYENFVPGIVEFKMKANNTPLNYDGILFQPEHFSSIYYEAINIDRHIEFAYKDRMYAQYWLIILFLTTNFIRGIDILNSPILEYPYSYEWKYFMENEISMTEAQMICNYFSLNAENIRVTKNKQKKQLYFLQDQIKAVATALVICTDYAKNKKQNKLFTVRQIDKERIYKKLGEPFYGITSRKMNYTIATFFEEEGNDAVEYRRQVYSYLSMMRSHKLNSKMGTTDTTMIYIKANSKDSSVSEVAYHTSVRGAFGWLYHILLDYINEKFDSLEDETNRILEIENRYSPNEIEEISEYLIQEKMLRNKVLKALKVFKKSDVKMFLESIGTVQTVGKMKEFPCMLGKSCPMKGANCAYCGFSIKTIHGLLVYKDELYKIIDTIEHEDNEVVLKKNLYLFYKIKLVINEFKKEFNHIDKQYINAFIDMKEVKQRMNSLSASKAYILQEVLEDEKCIEGFPET